MNPANPLPPELPQEQTDSPASPTPKPHIVIIKRLIKAALALLALGLVFIIGFIVVTAIQDRIGKSNQQKAYSQAVDKCGKDPVVIVGSVNPLYGTKSYDLYTPFNSQYAEKKAIHNDGPFSFGSETVEDYYCSPEEARVANKYVDDDTTNNYSLQERKQMAAAILKDYTSSTGVILYQISELPPSLELEDLTVSANPDDEYDSIHDPYEFRFTLKGSDKKDLKEVTFKCNSDQTLKPTVNNDVIYHTDSKAKKDLTSPQVVVDYSSDGESGHHWRASAYWNTRSNCDLSDRYGLITKEEGNKMLKRLVAIDLSSLQSEQLNVYLR